MKGYFCEYQQSYDEFHDAVYTWQIFLIILWDMLSHFFTWIKEYFYIDLYITKYIDQYIITFIKNLK